MNELYTSIVKFDFQYAHRFMNWPREAKHLHGHSGFLEIELEDKVDPVTGYAHACKTSRSPTHSPARPVPAYPIKASAL